MSRRVATFFDMKLYARGRSRAEGNTADFPAQPKSMREIKQIVEDLRAGGDNFLSKGQSDKADKYYIAHTDTVDGYWVLLINRCDPSAPDSVYSNPESKERTVNEKLPGQGSEFSAHLILNLDPVLGEGYYFCIIEASYGAGLGSSAITSYFAHVIRHCKKQKPLLFKIPNIDGSSDKKGQAQLVHLNHEVELHGHISESFKTDLQSGALGGIELISYKSVGGKWDDAGFVKEKHRVIKLELEKDLIGDAIKTVTDVLRNAKSDGMSEMRVSFKDGSGSPNSALLSVDTGQLATDGRYLKRYYISSANNVSSASIENVNHAIVREVLKSLE
ncbi:hypothetical protein [Pseudomonas izuensis]|uniref:Nucleoid-associated protein n=1 Tax=Pseudomonas izuensis TaxID=2684212 RepID=A0ABM7RTU4_9PSED|nr:hypothetical protein [Pseudomonas izuensis]BCX67937.1 hypothetical protein LAB08_R25760 [Pseudomonas izuensis]